MGPIIFVVALVIVVVVWFLTRGLPKNTAYASRIVTVGLGVMIGGLVMRTSEDSLITMGGAILTSVGILFIIFGVIIFIRAYLIGEFRQK